MIRIGIIGGGFGTTGLLPAFTGIPGCRVVGVCEKRTEWKAFLKRTDLDAVAIAVPPHAQYAIAKAAIARGLHVFAEKPLAANLKEARTLYALAKKKRIVHGIDLMFPEIAAWKKVKELLSKEAYGKLQHVSVNWEWQSGDIRYKKKTWRSDPAAGGGALAFYFSHGLYYLEHFAGAIGTTRSLFTRSPKSLGAGETGFDLLLQFKNGAHGHAHVSCSSELMPQHRIVFRCTKGTIVLENKNAVVDNFSVTICTATGEKRVSVTKDTQRRGEDERVKVVRKLAQRFIAACHGRATMSPSFVDAVRVQELIERVRAERMK